MKLKMTLIVDDAAPGQAIGIKEAIAMDIEEKYGDVQVLQLDVWEPEQLVMGGIAPMHPAAELVAPANRKPPAESAAIRAGRQISVSMACCLSCVNYIKTYGRDESGTPYWGRCRKGGKWVYSLKDQCKSYDARK